MLLFLSYWITVYGSDEFLIYAGDDKELIYHLLPTVPVFCMLVEFPFNMIQFEWPMLIFVELLFTIYLLINLLHVAMNSSHTTVYPDFDWYGNTEQSIGYCIACIVLIAIFFGIFWVITIKVKLPRYAKRTQKKYEAM